MDTLKDGQPRGEDDATPLVLRGSTQETSETLGDSQYLGEPEDEVGGEIVEVKRNGERPRWRVGGDESPDNFEAAITEINFREGLDPEDESAPDMIKTMIEMLENCCRVVAAWLQDLPMHSYTEKLRADVGALGNEMMILSSKLTKMMREGFEKSEFDMDQVRELKFAVDTEGRRWQKLRPVVAQMMGSNEEKDEGKKEDEKFETPSKLDGPTTPPKKKPRTLVLDLCQ